MKYRCWDVERHEETDGAEFGEIEAVTHADAAEKFCERRFSSDSYPQHRVIRVLALDLKDFNVETRNSPEFHATEKR